MRKALGLLSLVLAVAPAARAADVEAGKARAATVTADTHLLALAISRDRLAEVMTTNPTAAAHMRGITAAMYG